MTEQDQVDFFNDSLPCPESIKDCQHLREQYFKEIEKYTQERVCNSCIQRSLRNKYLSIILSSNQ